MLLYGIVLRLGKESVADKTTGTHTDGGREKRRVIETERERERKRDRDRDRETHRDTERKR